MKIASKHCDRTVGLDYQRYPLIYPNRQHYLCSVWQVGNSRCFTERGLCGNVCCHCSLVLVKVQAGHPLSNSI
ncbi:hypothetical protein B1T45_08310 [Mycobacterium kansasii]|uniref:Uncharacterized protein n=2 Tax=Mycobacterium kansasii TaxID=1768 RepID=A0A653EU27_MYCKA|nr:hypothetical protein MKAN_20810 [Mycobacterium kansasii ATCC 12478]ARG55909.1 hypothetical protein B1T43_08580 [Mycobacterium kansasii]ARG61299.1 hypothetical protein B1T45_08310 [Mycobacterium kansasii]ARG69007.1 hypothetical protein B1T47_08090 [Mycobacterium kansasii]ARG76363.1 hypothetical protein B1T51_19950 [Mycobacterium kansasii]